MKNDKILKGLGYAIVSITIAVTLGGCAKEREYRTVYKDNQVQPAGLKEPLTQKEFLYSASQLESPHSTQGTFPGYMGDLRIVKFRFDEKSLIVESVIEDGRFADNTANAKPVMTIPVQHVQYRCADNGAGECANREEENNDIPWNKKNQFKTEIAGMKVSEISVLPLELDTAFPGACQSEIGSRVIDAKFTADTVNIEIEKTYRANGECVDWAALESIGDLTFSVRNMYSFVARDTVLSKNYETVEYPQMGQKTDENTFGFFTTAMNRLSTDLRPEESGQKVMVNRWNPNRKVIQYALTPNYNKPENAALKAATLEGVQAVNNALKEADVDLQIEIAPEAHNNYGDVRNSMLVLVEDPQATGVIGYGPSNADPRTGEIISGRVVMYSGTMKKFIRTSWDEIVDESRAKKASASKTSEESKTPKLSQVTGNVLKAQSNQFDIHSFMDKRFPSFNKKISSLESGTKGTVGGLKPERNISDRELKKIVQQATRIRDRDFKGSPLMDEDHVLAKRHNRLDAISKFNVYPAELIDFKGAIELSSLEGLKDVRKVYWLELTEEERQKVMEVTLPYVWVPTLVHEFGHNMGLRHNFQGSEDKENFYTKDELSKYGHTHDMIYSSVMDYGYRSVSELRIMGKYDVAALRYGYRREVQTTDGQFVKLPAGKTKGPGGIELASSIEALPSQIQENLKSYKFCTDEGVGINAGCRRQDEGTTYTEIATHLRDAYLKNYRNSNFRNGRVHFSDRDDGIYANRMAGVFFDMRPFFELYDRIISEFGVSATDPRWNTEPFLKDIKGATQVALDAMFEPMLMPPASCIFKTPDGRFIPLAQNDLGVHFPSCFEDSIMNFAAKNGVTVHADAGREFQNQKFEGSTNPYVDQIDVRGIWAEKILAPMFMTTRRTGVSTWDKSTTNYLDRFPDAANRLQGIIQGFLLNSVKAKNVEAKLANGETMVFDEYSYSPDSTHWMPVFRSRSLRQALGVGTDETPYAQVLLRMVLKEMKDSVPNEQARKLKDYFGLHFKIKEGDSIDQYVKIDVDGSRYLALKGVNLFAEGVNDLRSLTSILEKVEEKRLEVVLAEAKKAGQSEREAAREAAQAEARGEGNTLKTVPVVLTEDEKAAVALGADVIEAFMNGVFQESTYYNRVLKMLGEVNEEVIY
jgi:hypothetical protein